MYTEFHLDPALSGAHNMAVDEGLFHRFNNPDFLGMRGERDFCSVRVYEWSAPTLSIGFSQENKDIFNDRARREGIERVTRITGGRVVLHHQEITYSVVGAVNGILGNGLHPTYEIICDILMVFLRKLGLQPDKQRERISGNSRSLVCYDRIGFKEISLGGKKLVGSAQKRGKRAFLQHGSIPYYRHDYRVEDYLKEEFLNTSDPDRYIFVNDFIDTPIESAKQVLLEVFKEEVSRRDPEFHREKDSKDSIPQNIR